MKSDRCSSNDGIRRVDDEIIIRAAASSSATMHEAAGRTGALPAFIKPLDRTMKFAGRALPVRSPAGDNLQLHCALARAKPGDAIIVDVGEGRNFGYWGEIMATAAMVRGVNALVTSGGVRDSARLIELGLPTFAGVVAIQGTTKDSSRDGAVGEPIRIGDVVIREGDLVMGDADGVVCYGAHRAEAIIQASEARDQAEQEILKSICTGALTLDVYKF